MFHAPQGGGGASRGGGNCGQGPSLHRLWNSVEEARGEGRAAESSARPAAGDEAVLRKLHQTIRKVGDDTARLSYNTAIAAMMEYMNVLRGGERVPHRDEVLPLVQLVAPYAPHLAEELWERLGGTGSVMDAGWPAYDAALAAESSVELVVQVNGKLRGRVRVAKDVTQDAALAAALAEEGVAKFVTGAPKKVVFVPGRLLNIVV